LIIVKLLFELYQQLGYKQNPEKSNDRYRFYISLSVEDGNKLDQLFNKWHDEDNPVIENKSFWSKFLNYFNL
jgi:hypothetical protein